MAVDHGSTLRAPMTLEVAPASQVAEPKQKGGRSLGKEPT